MLCPLFLYFFFSFSQKTYIFTFLLSSRVFIPPHDLLARVGQICLEQRQQLEAGSEKVRCMLTRWCLSPFLWLPIPFLLRVSR